MIIFRPISNSLVVLNKLGNNLIQFSEALTTSSLYFINFDIKSLLSTFNFKLNVDHSGKVGIYTAPIMIEYLKVSDDVHVYQNPINSTVNLVITAQNSLRVDLNTNNLKPGVNNYIDIIIRKYPSISYYPIIFISVKENKRVRQVLSQCLKIFNERNKKIKTRILNSWLSRELKQNHPLEYGPAISVYL